MPVPLFSNAVAPLTLSRITPEISPVPAVDPWRVSVLAPPPEFETVESCKGPLPDESMVTAPEVLASATVRVVTSPGPTYSSGLFLN